MTQNNNAGPSYSQVLFVSVLAAVITSGLTTYGLRIFDQPAAQTSQGTPQIGAEPSTGAVSVPSLEEMPSESAGELVRARGLRLVVTGTEPSELDEGRVVSQSPLPGSSLPSGEAVEVVLSAGAPQITIPAIVGQATAQARAAIEALGLIVETEEVEGGGPPGTVVTAAPAPGIEVNGGSTVHLIVTAEGIEVPELVGTQYRRARGTLEDLGLVLGRVRRRYNERRADLVITEQEPEAGARVPAGTEVTITIND